MILAPDLPNLYSFSPNGTLDLLSGGAFGIDRETLVLLLGDSDVHPALSVAPTHRAGPAGGGERRV